MLTHQLNAKTCKIQNNKASPKFFHCKKNIFLVFKNFEILLLCLELKMGRMFTHPKGSTERQYKAGLQG